MQRAKLRKNNAEEVYPATLGERSDILRVPESVWHHSRHSWNDVKIKGRWDCFKACMIALHATLFLKAVNGDVFRVCSDPLRGAQQKDQCILQWDFGAFFTTKVFSFHYNRWTWFLGSCLWQASD